jgi:aspartyl-tRNA synthetase
MRRLRLGQAGPAREARIHRPDRRHGDVDFKVFSTPANTKDGRVVALRVPGGARSARGEIDATRNSCASTARRAWPGSRSTTSPRAATACKARSSRTCTTQAIKAIIERTGAQTATSFSSAPIKCEGRQRQPRRAAFEDRSFRIRQGQRPVRNRWKPLWVVDFPMFEYDEEDNRWTSPRIIPFTSPKDGIWSIWTRIRAAASRRPTTWC